MRKSTFALACVLVLVVAVSARAQAPGVGLKGGLTIAKLTGDVENLDSRTGFMIGGYAGLGLGEGMRLLPEIYYAQKGAKMTVLETEVTMKFDYIDIPVLFEYTVAGAGAQPYFLFGPSIGLKIKAEREAEGMTEDFSPYVKPTDFGLVFGLGVNMNRFLIEARYSLGLTNINDDGTDPASVKNSVIAFQIGYAFPTP